MFTADERVKSDVGQLSGFNRRSHIGAKGGRSSRSATVLYLVLCVAVGVAAAMAMSGVAYANGCVSATRYVSATGNNSGNDCSNPATPCATIQQGIDTACPGDTVSVGPGTYSVGGGGCGMWCGATVVEINKSVTLRSTSGPAATIIDGNSASGNYYVVRIDASNVIVDGFTITNPIYGLSPGPGLGRADASGIAINTPAGPAYSNIRITNCIVHDIGILTRTPAEFGTMGINSGPVNGLEIDHCQVYSIGNADPDYWALGIFVWGDVDMAQNVNVHDNVIHDIIHPNFSIAVNAASGGVQTVVIDHNTVSGEAIYGIRSSGSFLGDVTITNNTVSGSSGACIQLNGSAPPQIVKQNTIGGCATGIAVGSSAAPPQVHLNRIVGNTVGLNALAASTTDAENNWWGCNEGPGAPGCDTAIGSVDFDPWLVLGIEGTGTISDGPPPVITQCDTSTLTARLTVNSDDVDTSAAGHVPDGPIVTFATNLGGVSPVTRPLTNGLAVSTLYPDCVPGDATVSAHLDAATVTNVVTIDPSAPHVVSFSTLKGNRLTVGSRGRFTIGSLVNDNDTVTPSLPNGDLEPTLLSNTAIVEVHDLGGVFSATVPLTGCTQRTGAGSEIRCRSDGVRARFKPVHGLPHVFKMKVSARGLTTAETGTQQPIGPVNVILRQNATCRYDCIEEICRTSGPHGLVCREP